MPNRGQQLGKRRPFTRRPGIGKFLPWDGMNREGDPASVPANAFRMLINTRTDDSEIRCRGGQASLNPDDVIDGCVTGVFPPEFEPPDQAFKRLLIAEAYLYVPDESDEVTVINSGDNSLVVELYWSGERLLVIRYDSNDGGEGSIRENRIDTSTGTSTIQDVASPAGINLTWDGSPGGIVEAGGEYYAARYDSGADPAEGVRLERITFGSSDFEFDDEDTVANADVSGGAFFVTSSIDGRVYWCGKTASVAELSIRSVATGAYSAVSFPTGFESVAISLQSWAWHAAKLYIAGVNGTDLVICAYDPVANTISAARTISGTDQDHCAMAVHKGVLYFAYGLSGGAERLGMLRKGVWQDSILAFPAPADIVDLCSFQDYLYMTKGEFLLRCSDPADDPTFETFFTEPNAHALGPMVALP
jgi:hypothetical protein